MREQSVDDLDRLLRIVHGDVHVHSEDELAAGDVLQLVDQRVVAVLRSDPLSLEEAERVRSGRADARSLLVRDLRDVCAQRREPAHHVARVVADRGRDLEHRLHELRVDPRLELVSGDRGEHRVDVLDEVERVGIEELVLLLDAERVRVAGSERVVEDAPCRFRPFPVIEDGKACLPVTGELPRPRSRPSSAGRRGRRERSCWPGARRRRPPRARERSRRSRRHW